MKALGITLVPFLCVVLPSNIASRWQLIETLWGNQRAGILQGMMSGYCFLTRL
jgi:hypothetical protein